MIQDNLRYSTFKIKQTKNFKKMLIYDFLVLFYLLYLKKQPKTRRVEAEQKLYPTVKYRYILII